MKKIIVFLAIVALACVSGCSCPRADSTGVITKNFTNCLETAQDIICDPPPEVLAGSNILLNLLKPVANTYVPGTAEFNAYVTAENITSIGCASVTGLNGLIAYLQSKQAQTLMLEKGEATALSIQPFIDWRNKTK